MARCEDCIHYDICTFHVNGNECDKCTHFKNTADVVPKSEVDMSQHLLKDAWKRIEELDNLCGELQKAKTEVAREIFEEIEKAVEDAEFEFGTFFGVKLAIAELKKKYTEGNNG